MLSSSFLMWYWNERFWLPRNVTWADLRNTDEAVFAQAFDLWFALPYSMILYGIRILIERLIARPVGRHLEIPDVPNKSPSYNIVLERVYEKVTKNPQGERLEGLCKQLDWKEKQVLKWFRRKRDQHRPSKLAKFSETMWRFLFYSCVFSFGLVANFQTDCPVRTQSCWEGYPDKHLLNSMTYWYYLTEFSFYLSCIVSQFFDIKRKDFWVMFFHHVATVFLIFFSYSINMTRIGMLIMLIHDFSDIFLESSKLAKYTQRECLGTLGLVCFALSFSMARLVYFPFWILHSVYFEVWYIVGSFPSWYIFSFWLALLQGLHVYWYSFIIKGFVLFVKNRGKVDDIRSDTEDSDSDEEAIESRPKPVVVNASGDSPINGVTMRRSHK